MAEKEHEQGDPFEMVQMVLDAPADDDFYREMAQTFVEEYMMMGWTDEKLLSMFRDPFYQGPHSILQKKGELFVTQLIREVRNG